MLECIANPRHQVIGLSLGNLNSTIKYTFNKLHDNRRFTIIVD